MFSRRDDTDGPATLSICVNAPHASTEGWEMSDQPHGADGKWRRVTGCKSQGRALGHREPAPHDEPAV